MLYVTVIIASNVIAVKILQIGFIEIPAAIILYPLSFVLDDVFTEVYGYKRIRPIIWMAFLCNIFIVVMFQISVWLPHLARWTGQAAYATVLSQVPRIVFASFIATPTGQFVNAYVLAKLKIKTAGRNLSFRLVLSTFCGACIDSILFISIAFVGKLPFHDIVIMIVSQTIVKVIYEIVLLPVSIPVIKVLKRRENSNYFDTTTNFNPFKL